MLGTKQCSICTINIDDSWLMGWLKKRGGQSALRWINSRTRKWNMKQGNRYSRIWCHYRYLTVNWSRSTKKWNLRVMINQVDWNLPGSLQGKTLETSKWWINQHAIPDFTMKTFFSWEELLEFKYQLEIACHCSYSATYIHTDAEEVTRKII